MGYLDGAGALVLDVFAGPGPARPRTGSRRQFVRRNRLNHIGKLSFMSITSAFLGCKSLCSAKPLFRQGKDTGRVLKVIKVSRTSPGRPWNWQARTVRRSSKPGGGLAPPAAFPIGSRLRPGSGRKRPRGRRIQRGSRAGGGRLTTRRHRCAGLWSCGLCCRLAFFLGGFFLFTRDPS